MRLKRFYKSFVWEKMLINECRLVVWQRYRTQNDIGLKTTTNSNSRGLSIILRFSVRQFYKMLLLSYDDCN